MRIRLCLVLLLLSVAPSGAQLFETGMLVLFDANDQVVGPMTDLTGSGPNAPRMAVFVNKLPRLLEFRLNNQGTYDLSSSFFTPVVFSTPDCSGTTFIVRRTPFWGTNPAGAIAAPELMLFVRAPNVLAQTVVVQSELDVNGACVPAGPYSANALEAVAVDTGLVAPFAVGLGPSMEPLGSALAIPTLQGWGQFLLGMLVTLAGIYFLSFRRKRQLSDT